MTFTQDLAAWAHGLHSSLLESCSRLTGLHWLLTHLEDIMRRRLLGITGILIGAIALAGSAQAATLLWTGSTFLALGETAPTIFTGTGVATVGSGGGGSTHLGSFRLACDDPGNPGGCPISGQLTTPLTDPENASLVTLIATARLGTGTFTGIAGSPAAIGGNAKRGVPGESQLCILLANCLSPLPIPFTVNGTIGAGMGGIVTVNTFATGNGVRVSLFGAPWTVGVATTTNVRTPKPPNGGGNLGTRSIAGFVHGPASASSTAAQVGGVIQTVFASAVRTSLNPNSDNIFFRGFGRFVFIPEPGMILLLASGGAGLVLLGRRRSKK
jgi:hypothetical protein